MAKIRCTILIHDLFTLINRITNNSKQKTSIFIGLRSRRILLPLLNPIYFSKPSLVKFFRKHINKRTYNIGMTKSVANKAGIWQKKILF